jgi:hypothetical protein
VPQGMNKFFVAAHPNPACASDWNTLALHKKRGATDGDQADRAVRQYANQFS